MTHEVVTTASGKRAVRELATGEVMHPIGPREEAELLYVRPSRLVERLCDDECAVPLTVLDMGLGAGSNALAALRATELKGVRRKLHLLSVDVTTRALELALLPEHRSHFGFEGHAFQAATQLLQHGVYESSTLHWQLLAREAHEVIAQLPLDSIDVVFWDPFSPRKNPSMWSIALFATLFTRCRAGATLHTYSAATATRAALLLAGFCVGFGPGVEGKQPATTIASLHPHQLTAPLDARWLSRLSRSSAAFYADAPLDALERVRHHRQFALDAATSVQVEQQPDPGAQRDEQQASHEPAPLPLT